MRENRARAAAHPTGAAERSRTVRLATAVGDAPTLLAQATAALSVWPPPADLVLGQVDDPAQLPVGLADRALLWLHEQVLGAPLEHTVPCPECGEWTTLPLGRHDVGEHHPYCAWTGPGSGVREPSWADVEAADGDLGALLERCRIGDGGGLAELAGIEGSLSGPLHAACHACGAHLEVDVDVVALVLGALLRVSAELDQDVHVLAARYGWQLGVIEALPDERRRRLAALAGSSS